MSECNKENCKCSEQKPIDEQEIKFVQKVKVCPKCGFKNGSHIDEGGLFAFGLHSGLGTDSDGDYCMNCWINHIKENVTCISDVEITEG